MSVMDELFETLVKEVRKGSFILDIGINNGELTKKCLEELHPVFLKGVESESKEKVGCVIRPAHNVELLYNQSIETFKDRRKYDLVIMFKTLHYTAFPEPAEAVVIAKKFLGPNGLLLLGLTLNPNTDEGDRRTVNLQYVKGQLRFHSFSRVFDKQVDPYDSVYHGTYILLYRLS